MSEQELFELMAARADVNWEIFQFWSGVTFAYIAVSHFAAKNMNWLIILVLTILYASLSLVVYQLAANNLLVLEAFNLELQALSESTEVSAASKAWLQLSTTTPQLIALSIATLGTFICALLYLPYNYYRARNTANGPTADIQEAPSA